MISGALFLAWRIFEIIILIPIMGMLAWFVHQYVEANQLTPATILVMFIVSVIALAWAVFTTIDYLRARHDAFFVALFDLGLVGALIAGVYYLRGPGTTDCNSFSTGIAGTVVYLNLNINKTCTMLKASFALGIIAIIAFFVTFVSWNLDALIVYNATGHSANTLPQLLALMVHRNHRNDDRTVIKREYRTSSHGGRHRSRSRDYRAPRDYGYDSRPRSSGRSHHSSRRQYYV
ncbi:hypothetical protein D0867_02344 [Hortaea werneckii]|uniref:MARVEL domain-containing protein n=1 Tax=Hortaea werneckii TaxID=91943 RepID=A0A3M7A6D6_HORWE|nr:hypothetical protein D0867_02344 [Hortaea werneckii]